LTIDLRWTLDQIAKLNADAGAGFAVAAFLASGGPGYLFRVIHHTAHQRLRGRLVSAIDHTRIVERLSQADFLDLKKVVSGNPVETKKIDPCSAIRGCAKWVKAAVGVAELDMHTGWPTECQKFAPECPAGALFRQPIGTRRADGQPAELYAIVDLFAAGGPQLPP
jgi:hypothetical protein